MTHPCRKFDWRLQRGQKCQGFTSTFGGLGKALDAMGRSGIDKDGTHGTPGMLGSMDVHPQSNIVFQCISGVLTALPPTTIWELKPEWTAQ